MLAAVWALTLPIAVADTPPAELARQAVERGLDPDGLIWAWQLSPEARSWLDRQAVGRRPEERLRVAFHQLVSESGRGLRYDPTVTGTAAEVFASGRANCLGFSLLFVGLARELGVDATFLRIDEVRRFSREGDLILISEHVTAGYESGGEARLVEFTLGPAVDYNNARPMSDLAALGLFYSNRGAEALRGGDAAEAERWLEVAVRLDPEAAAAWTNLGVARRRLGQLERAEQAYRRALGADADHLAAYMNLVTVRRLQGEDRAAVEILRLLDRSDNRNPFTYLALGDTSLEEGRLDDARRFFRRALRLAGRQAEPRAAMGQLALSRGDLSAAMRWLRRARKIDEEDARTRRLEERINELVAAEAAAGAAAGEGPRGEARS